MRTLKTILGDTEELLFNDLCYLDFKFWAERVFGFEVKWFHLEWMQTVHNNRFTVIKAFRGSGKTTFLGVVYPLWLCWFRPGTHILFTAAELNQSIKILDEVKETIENNEFLKELMPANPSTWKKTELKMTNGSKVFCKAYTKHIKGVHVNYVFADEVQDCHDREIYYKAIAPTVNHKKGHIVAVGVSDNPGDLIEELSAKKEYIDKEYPVLSEPGKSIWPEKFSVNEIEAIRKRDGEAAFQTQYMINPKAEREGAVFPISWIDNCFDLNEKFLLKPKHEESICIMGCDFAMSDGVRADYDAYVVVEKISGKTIIRHAERHKGFPKDAKLQRIRELKDQYHCLRVICDPSGIGTAIIQDLRKEGCPVQEGEFHSRARHGLLVNLQSMMQPNNNGVSELVIPRDPEDDLTMNFTNTLIDELMGFKEEKSATTGMKSYSSKATHDDTVMALALACKGATEQREFVDIVAM